MKWLTLQEIKAQLRIDSDCCIEDSLLTRYGASAEGDDIAINEANG